MQSALFLPLFNELFDPHVVVELTVEAEARGWDGVFVLDADVRAAIENGPPPR